MIFQFVVSVYEIRYTGENLCPGSLNFIFWNKIREFFGRMPMFRQKYVTWIGRYYVTVAQWNLLGIVIVLWFNVNFCPFYCLLFFQFVFWSLFLSVRLLVLPVVGSMVLFVKEVKRHQTWLRDKFKICSGHALEYVWCRGFIYTLPLCLVLIN